MSSDLDLKGWANIDLRSRERVEVYLKDVDAALDDEDAVEISIPVNINVAPTGDAKPDANNNASPKEPRLTGFGEGGKELMTRAIEPEHEPWPTRNTWHPYLVWKDATKDADGPSPSTPPVIPPVSDDCPLHKVVANNIAMPLRISKRKIMRIAI